MLVLIPVHYEKVVVTPLLKTTNFGVSDLSAHCTKYQAKLTHSGNSMLVFEFGL